MTVKISMGIEVEVDDFGNITLPRDTFTSAQLKKIAREVDKAVRISNCRQELDEGGY
jgi:hypothetical protein